MTIIRTPVRSEDAGFFGPDSVAWRISGPTVVPALVYTGVMFFLSPHLSEIGYKNTKVGHDDPYGVKRAIETFEYIYAIVYGDKATARHAADVVNALHDQVNGTWEPTSDRIHRASDPDNLLWLLIPFGQGLLDAYDAYGPKKLTPDERDRFWREEVTIIGELNRIPLGRLPKSQREADAYLESQRPRLATHAFAAELFANLYPSLWRGSTYVPAIAALPVTLLLAPGLALLPDWAVTLAGQRPYPRVMKAAITAANRPIYGALTAIPLVRDLLPLTTSPSTRTLLRKAREGARTGRYDAPEATTRTRHLTTA